MHKFFRSQVNSFVVRIQIIGDKTIFFFPYYTYMVSFNIHWQLQKSFKTTLPHTHTYTHIHTEAFIHMFAI